MALLLALLLILSGWGSFNLVAAPSRKIEEMSQVDPWVAAEFSCGDLSGNPQKQEVPYGPPDRD